MNVEYFGIDFGTTNIAVAGLIVDEEEKKAYRVLYSDKGLPFPSLIAINEDEEVQFGSKVKSRTVELQDEGYTIIKSVKTYMGSDVKFSVGKRRVAPVRAAAYLIKSIRQYIYIDSGKRVEIDKATVAVPVSFTQAQRKDVIDAFSLAGVKVDKIISEPVAAYIRNREDVRNQGNVLVFDWGGGTLDLSLLNVSDGMVDEIATEGWPVAGDRIDSDVAEYVHGRLVAEGKVDVPFRDISEKDRIKILAECEQAKMEFSGGEEECNIFMVEYCGRKGVSLILKNTEFEAKIMKTVTRAVELIDVVLEKANMSRVDLQALIMVGGSSNLLPLRSYVEQCFPRDRYNVVYPDKPQWSVAEGAALMDSVNCGYTLNQDIGIVLGGLDHTMQEIFPVIKKGTPIPFEGDRIFFGTVDDAASANFLIADDKSNLIDTVVMKSHGFVGEQYYVTGAVDNTLIATITVVGRYMSVETEPRIVSINGLSIRCDISEILNYDYQIMAAGQK